MSSIYGHLDKGGMQNVIDKIGNHLAIGQYKLMKQAKRYRRIKSLTRLKREKKHVLVPLREIRLLHYRLQIQQFIAAKGRNFFRKTMRDKGLFDFTQPFYIERTRYVFHLERCKALVMQFFRADEIGYTMNEKEWRCLAFEIIDSLTTDRFRRVYKRTPHNPNLY